MTSRKMVLSVPTANVKYILFEVFKQVFISSLSVSKKCPKCFVVLEAKQIIIKY